LRRNRAISVDPAIAPVADWPPVYRRLNINENVRGLSAYVSTG
jgi:hypothetical protein